jgi:hypothetical protein
MFLFLFTILVIWLHYLVISSLSLTCSKVIFIWSRTALRYILLAHCVPYIMYSWTCFSWLVANHRLSISPLFTSCLVFTVSLLARSNRKVRRFCSWELWCNLIFLRRLLVLLSISLSWEHTGLFLLAVWCSLLLSPSRVIWSSGLGLAI